MSELLSLVALVVAAMLGFAWMGEGGAVVFALLGLWGCHGAARPWRLGRHGIGLLTVLATLFPAALWLIGALRPDFAQAVLDAFPQIPDHLKPQALEMLEVLARWRQFD